MWGNKKSEPVTQPAVPAQSMPAEKKSSQSVATSLEGKVMSTDVATRPSVMPSTGSSARLGATLHVKGEISGSEDLHVDGSIEGLVQLEERKLTVGASARVTADVVAREVVVYGNVKGNVRARDKVEIRKDGSVVGDIATARIMIEDGAYFKGSIEIDRNASVSSSDFAAPSYRGAPAPVGSSR
jgi:cytoskeletal protein CcmA (bactofilin family)